MIKYEVVVLGRSCSAIKLLALYVTLARRLITQLTDIVFSFLENSPLNYWTRRGLGHLHVY